MAMSIYLCGLPHDDLVDVSATRTRDETFSRDRQPAYRAAMRECENGAGAVLLLNLGKGPQLDGAILAAARKHAALQLHAEHGPAAMSERA